MEKFKEEFIDFMLECGELRFGDFVTKSGRKTPFFINTGFYKSGSQLKRLGHFYAKAIEKAFGTDFDILFGPAYKGIPLAVSASMAMYEDYGREICYCSNRKEIKDHGDRGSFLGGPVAEGNRVVIIEDVTTAGTSIEETLPLIRSVDNVTVAGLCVSVDRQERGTSAKSALKEIQEKYGFPTTAIVTMSEVRSFLETRSASGKDGFVMDSELSAAIDAYYEKYGAEE